MKQNPRIGVKWIWCCLFAVIGIQNLNAMVPQPDRDFFSTYWKYHTTINLNTTSGHATISGEVDEFPVVIRLDEGNFQGFGNISDQGTDIRFTTSDYTEIPYQIEKWDHDQNKLVIWVRVPQIFADNSAQNIIMHYGFSDPSGNYGGDPSAADPYSIPIVKQGSFFWGVCTDNMWYWKYTFNNSEYQEEFIANWQNSHDGMDASPNNHDLLFSDWQDLHTGEGFIGDAVYADAGSNASMGTDIGSYPGQITLSCWLNPTSSGPCGNYPSSANAVFILGNYDVVLHLYEDGCNSWIESYYKGISGDYNFVDWWYVPWSVPNGWMHIALIIDPSHGDERCYYNGSLYDGGRAFTEPIQYDNSGLTIFRTNADYATYVGQADEIRVEAVARSDDWIKLCYQNQKADQSFVEIRQEYSPNMCGSGQDMAVDGNADFKSDIAVNGNGYFRSGIAVDGNANLRSNAGIAGVLTIGKPASDGLPIQDQKLLVNGRVKCDGVQIQNWLLSQAPDYVFASDYKLPELNTIESYIKANHHLPEVPSAEEMKQNGVELTRLNMILLKKVEELTLYTIEMRKRLIDAESKLAGLKVDKK